MILFVLSLLISNSISAQPDRVLAMGGEQSDCVKIRNFVDCCLQVDHINDMEERRNARTYQCAKQCCLIGCCALCFKIHSSYRTLRFLEHTCSGLCLARFAVESFCRGNNGNVWDIPYDCTDFLLNTLLLECCCLIPDNRGPQQQNMVE